MEELSGALMTRETGAAGDFRGKPGRRQITILTRDAWEAACREIGADLPWTTRRANLFLDGVNLRGKIGYDLRVGGAVIRITGETTPCQRMEESSAGLMAALKPKWRGGVTAYVIEEGEAQVGCEVVLTRRLLCQYSALGRHHLRRILKRARRVAGKAARTFGIQGSQRA